MLALLGLLTTLAISPPDSSADLRAFRVILDDFQLAFNTRDADRFVKHFAPEGDFMQAFGRYRPDRAETHAFMRMFFSLQSADFKSVELGTRVRRVTDDVAFIELEMTGDGVRNADGSEQPHRRGQLMLVVRKQDARWQVVSYRYLDIHPATIRKE
jgi:uncharacterized protein (TIGR02246 family)